MLEIGICDDRKEDRELLIEKLNEKKYTSDSFNIHEFSSAAKLLESDIDFDIIFLDIEMPEKSGIDILTENPHHFDSCKIVLLTSHTEFSMIGYEVNAYRYLSKPVQSLKLKELFKSYEKEILLNKTITVKSNARDVTIHLRNIIYAESHKNQIDIVTTSKRIHTTTRLKDLKDLLPTDFFYQPHKSYIINFSFIKQIDYANHRIVMSNGDYVELSIRNKNEIKNVYNNFLLR